MRLLLVRPEPGAAQTAAILRGRGHDVLVAPVLRIEPVTARIPAGPWDAVLITSANAARAVAAHAQGAVLIGIEAFAVGARSAEAARAAGFTRVNVADGDVAKLAEQVVAMKGAPVAGVAKKLLYLAGEDRAGDLAASLQCHGFSVETVVIYRAVAVAALPEAATAALKAGGIDGILHFSPRSAKTFLNLAAAAGLSSAALAPAHYCVSANVAAPLAAAGARTIWVATAPSEAQLLRLVEGDSAASSSAII